MTILVVEDNPSMREMLIAVLEREGYAVEGVGSGQEALEYLYQRTYSAHNGAYPRLILLDLMMPGMNGWAFRLRQMAEPRWSDIPVVIISEVSQLATHAAILRAADYLSKPISIGLLLAVVRKQYRTPQLVRSDAL